MWRLFLVREVSQGTNLFLCLCLRHTNQLNWRPLSTFSGSVAQLIASAAVDVPDCTFCLASSGTSLLPTTSVHCATNPCSMTTQLSLTWEALIHGSSSTLEF